MREQPNRCAKCAQALREGGQRSVGGGSFDMLGEQEFETALPGVADTLAWHRIDPHEWPGDPNAVRSFGRLPRVGGGVYIIARQRPTADRGPRWQVLKVGKNDLNLRERLQNGWVTTPQGRARYRAFTIFWSNTKAKPATVEYLIARTLLRVKPLVAHRQPWIPIKKIGGPVRVQNLLPQELAGYFAQSAPSAGTSRGVARGGAERVARPYRAYPATTYAGNTLTLHPTPPPSLGSEHAWEATPIGPSYRPRLEPKSSRSRFRSR